MSFLTSMLVVVILLIQFYCYLVMSSRWVIWVTKTKCAFTCFENKDFRRSDKSKLSSQKNWSLNTLKTVCQRVDEMGSAVTRHASTGRLIYDKTWDAILTCAQKPTWVSLIYHTDLLQEFMITATVSFQSRLRWYVAAADGHFEHSV